MDIKRRWRWDALTKWHEGFKAGANGVRPSPFVFGHEMPRAYQDAMRGAYDDGYLTAKALRDKAPDNPERWARCHEGEK